MAQSIVSDIRKGAPERPSPQDKNYRRIQVIGAGIGRTGTKSLSAALERLLGGKVYHSGTLIIQDEQDTLKWGEILNVDTPPLLVRQGLREMLAGYVAVTDTHGAAMTPELLELYPEAVVICTTRDEEGWWKSWKDMGGIGTAGVWFWCLRIMLAPVPTYRYFPRSLFEVWRRLSKSYGVDGVKGPADKGYITIHNEWLKRVVPPERLFFFNVKEGWGPLCKILDVEVPAEPFPRVNEQAQMKELVGQIMGQVYRTWGLILGGAALSVMVVVVGLSHLGSWAAIELR